MLNLTVVLSFLNSPENQDIVKHFEHEDGAKISEGVYTNVYNYFLSNNSNAYKLNFNDVSKIMYLYTLGSSYSGGSLFETDFMLFNVNNENQMLIEIQKIISTIRNEN